MNKVAMLIYTSHTSKIQFWVKVKVTDYLLNKKSLKTKYTNNAYIV